LDPSAFEQSAGFLRLRGADNPIERTAIHPESYPIVEKMAASLGVRVQDLVGNAELVGRIRLDEFAAERVGLATLSDIREELLRPGRDPRRSFALPKFRSDVRDVADLKEGMALEGIVTNVTNFGAFVDIGVHQDGLVHLSQISNRFVRDPREAVKVGDVVQVKVLSVEPETKRIGLSIKALLPQLNRRRHRPNERRPAESGEGPAAGGGREGGARDSRPGRPPTGRGDRDPRRDMRGRRPDRPEGRREGRREGRPRRPGDDRDRQAPMMLSFDTPSPTLPEGTDLSLSEKIEILRNKFRGNK
jgi:transcriptional accessory protein Tex/SPT6